MYITIRIFRISFRNCVSSLLRTHYRTLFLQAHSIWPKPRAFNPAKKSKGTPKFYRASKKKMHEIKQRKGSNDDKNARSSVSLIIIKIAVYWMYNFITKSIYIVNETRNIHKLVEGWHICIHYTMVVTMRGILINPA